MSSALSSLLVGLVVLAFFLYRQMAVRPVRQGRLTLPLVIVIIGLVDLRTAHGHLPAPALMVLAASLAVGVVLAGLRAYTVRLWLRDGQMVRQGTWLTIALWLVAMGLHLGSDAVIARVAPGAGALAEYSVLLYMGVVLAVQQLVVQYRAGQMAEQTA